MALKEFTRGQVNTGQPLKRNSTIRCTYVSVYIMFSYLMTWHYLSFFETVTFLLTKNKTNLIILNDKWNDRSIHKFTVKWWRDIWQWKLTDLFIHKSWNLHKEKCTFYNLHIVENITMNKLQQTIYLTYHRMDMPSHAKFSPNIFKLCRR